MINFTLPRAAADASPTGTGAARRTRTLWWEASSLGAGAARWPPAPLASDDVVVLMPYLDRARAAAAAAAMCATTARRLTVVAVEDDLGLGPVALWNRALLRVDSEFVAYAAQDVIPGDAWLDVALAVMRAAPDSGLLAFNDGKWHGRMAGFGLVRRRWLDPLFGRRLFHAGYFQHYADVELSLVALQQRRLIYHPSAVLREHDPGKPFRAVHAEDRALFRHRQAQGFDGLVHDPRLRRLFA